jgi:hypothetical protein
MSTSHRAELLCRRTLNCWTMNPGLDNELVAVVDCMVATSSSEVPLAAAAAKHPKPAVSVPRQAEGLLALAGGEPAWASPPEGPSSPSLLLMLVLVLLLLLLGVGWGEGVGRGEGPARWSEGPAGEASALPWVLAWARGQPAGEVPSPPDGPSSSPLLLAVACP